MAVAIDTTHDLKAYFFEELATKAREHCFTVEEQTLNYLSDLLYNYRRAENLYDYKDDSRTLTPLAEYYRLSVEAPTEYERRLLLRKLGDVSLFISSLYKDSLRRKPVGMNYYQSMGEGAYGSLATASTNATNSGLPVAFKQLSEQFESFVRLLASLAVSENADSLEPRADVLLQKIAQWEKSRCPKLKTELQLQGVFVDESVDANSSNSQNSEALVESTFYTDSKNLLH